MQGNNNKAIQPDQRRVALHKHNLNNELFPALYRMLHELWRGKLFETLSYYWLRQDTIQGQHLRPDGYYEFYESVRFSAVRGRYVSRDHRVWQFRRVLLHCLGLISTRRPKPGDNLTIVERKSIEIMYQNRIANYDDRYQPTTYITTQLWGLDKLYYSENQAQKWLDNPQQVQYLTKEGIIKVFGQELANEVYCDERGVPETSIYAKGVLRQTIIDICKRKGYTTKEQVITKVTKSIGKLRANKAWTIQSKGVLEEIGYKYHRPTKDDKAKYGIRANSSRWIITKKEPMGGVQE